MRASSPFGSLSVSLGCAAIVSLASVRPAGAVERIRLHYDAALVAADLRSPAARLTINAETAWFLVDTGAGTHVLASWFAGAAGVEPSTSVTTGVHGLDSTGRKLALRAVSGLSARREDGGLLHLRAAVVADFPPDFEKAGVGGVLSPQLLAAPGDAAALDLRVPELRLEPFPGAVRRLGARIVPRQQVRVCSPAIDAVPNLVYTIRVSSGGAQSFLVLDSGAIATKLAAGSPLTRGRRLSPGGQTWGLSGEPQLYRVSRRHRLEVAGYRARVDARVVETPRDPCGAEGILGLDVLRRCSLVFGGEDVAIRCGR